MARPPPPSLQSSARERAWNHGGVACGDSAGLLENACELRAGTCREFDNALLAAGSEKAGQGIPFQFS